MLNTLRARLWFGYSILILLVIGAFFVGLFITLNQTSALYKQIEIRLRIEEQTLTKLISQVPNDSIAAVESYLGGRPAGAAFRVFLLDNSGSVLIDSEGVSAPDISWQSSIGSRKRENTENSLLIRDSEGQTWIYVIRRLLETQQFLVISTPRGNLNLKFMLSDPMIRMILWVLLCSILISIFLTTLMDRWLAKPIRDMSTSARKMALHEGGELPVRGAREVQELAKAINNMNQQVREGQQSQRDFISDVSHELKTPLTSIQGFANAILDGIANDERAVHHAAKVISAEAERMLRLVVDLLTLTRFEGGVENLRLAPVNLCDILAAVVEKLSITADQSTVSIINSVQGLPSITADADRLTQVMTNLVDNAVKYSRPGGKVELSASVDKGCIFIKVEDHGIGILPENLEKIFNRFYRVDKSRSGGTRKSSGLGLPIARQIARSHGGDIQVASTIDCGTIFTLVLPVSHFR